LHQKVRGQPIGIKEGEGVEKGWGGFLLVVKSIYGEFIFDKNNQGPYETNGVIVEGMMGDMKGQSREYNDEQYLVWTISECAMGWYLMLWMMIFSYSLATWSTDGKIESPPKATNMAYIS
jgi:hypothetical protein